MKINSLIIAKDVIEFPADLLEVIASPDFYQQYPGRADYRPAYNNFENHRLTPEETAFHKQVNEFYQPIVQDFMKSINQEAYSKYNWNWWWNVYTPKSNHYQTHQHVTSTGLFGFSWVHFVQPVARKNLFAWTDPDNTLTLHKEVQNQIIFFPNWAYHQVKANTSNQTRITLSGNIDITTTTINYL
jgi:hypothetical protein